MNFDFYIFGTPNNKYDQFHCDSNSELFRGFKQNRQSNVELIVYRKNQLIYYTYLHYGLLSINHSEGAYLGMSMVFNGVCFYDVKGIFELFDKLCFSMVSEGEIIKQDEKGKIVFAVDKFIKEQAAIKDCRNYLQNSLENQFIQAQKDYTILDTSFNQTNLEVKNLLLNDGNLDIIDEVRKFRHIVLTSHKEPATELKKFKRKKWVLLLLVIAIAVVIGSIILIISNSNNQTPVVVENSKVNIQYGSTSQYSGEMLYTITGKYLCNIEYPQKVRLKIEISVDPISNKYFGQFINYEYKDTLFASEFIINAEDKEISNATLGVGTIIKNSLGEIEIISKPENAKKWNMRKLQ